MSELIQYREKKRLSRPELAREIGASRSMIFLVEKGKAKASPELANRWSDFLGIPDSKRYKIFFADRV